MSARPLFWLTILFMLGISAQRLFEDALPAGSDYFASTALILLAAVALCLRCSSRFPQFVLAGLLFSVFGIWAAQTAAPRLASPAALQPLLDGQPTAFVARVSAPPEYYPDKVRIPLRLLSALREGRQIPLETGVLLSIYRDDTTSSLWLPGDRMLVRMQLRPFRNFRNPGGFDYARYQAEKGFHAQGTVKNEFALIRLSPDSDSFPVSILDGMRRPIESFRQHALFWLVRSTDPDSAGFYAALILGYQHMLPPEWQDLISRTGLNHLLSVSGLHLGLVSLLFFFLVRFGIRLLHPGLLNRISDKQIAVWPALLCAVAYAFLAGFNVPPIWRSVLMLTVCFGAAFWYRAPDSLTVLGFAALCILLFDPNSMWQISFQLTFACILSIILVFPKLRKLKISGLHPKIGPGTLPGKVISQFEDAFLVSIAVNVLVLPLTIFYFNGFSLAGFAANIVLVPYMGFVILPWGLISLAAFAISESLAYPFILTGKWLLAGCLHLIRWFAGFSWSYFWTGSMPLFWLAAIYALLALILLRLSRRTRLAGLALLAVCTCAGAAWNSGNGAVTQKTLRVDAIDVGQGTATLVRFPSGETMLVDGGGFADDSFDIGRAVLAPFLWHLGIRRLDHVVVSHDHPDHRNGLRFVLAHFDAGMLWTTGIRAQGTTRMPPEEIASRRGIPIRTYPAMEEVFKIGDSVIRVCHPTQDFLKTGMYGDLNACSLVLEIAYGGTSVILTGDIGRDVETGLLPVLQKDRRVLLLAPHHGSANSNSPELLDALRPQAVIFSCGYRNRFGFPAQAVLQRYAERNIPTFRTDLDGAVHAISDGHRWAISGER